MSEQSAARRRCINCGMPFVPPKPTGVLPCRFSNSFYCSLECSQYRQESQWCEHVCFCWSGTHVRSKFARRIVAATQRRFAQLNRSKL